MQINATIIGQSITFGILIWFTMKFVWPNILTAMQAREQTIADGLDAATKGQKLLQDAKADIKSQLQATQQQVDSLLKQANTQAVQIVADAKQAAMQEKQRMLEATKVQIANEINLVKQNLRAEVAAIAFEAAKKVMQREVVLDDHAKVIAELKVENG